MPFEVQEEENVIKVGNDTQEVDGEVTREDLDNAAQTAGIKKFEAKDNDGEELNAQDFPYSGSVEIVEYNENA